MKTTFAWVFPLIALLSLGCGGRGIQPATANSWLRSSQTPAAINITGRWRSSDWGNGTILQTGNEFSGSLGGGRSTYNVKGVVNGKRVRILFLIGNTIWWTGELKAINKTTLRGHYSASGAILDPGNKSAMRMTGKIKRYSDSATKQVSKQKVRRVARTTPPPVSPRSDTGSFKLTKRERASLLIKRATKNYRMAKFKTAVSQYKQAFELVEHADLAFNIGQCHRQMEGAKNAKAAIFFYKLHLTIYTKQNNGKISPREKETNRYIGVLEDRLKPAEQPAAADDPAPKPKAERKEWFYAVGKKRLGPVAKGKILELLLQGKLTRKSLTWKKGMKDWKPLHKVKELTR